MVYMIVSASACDSVLLSLLLVYIPDTTPGGNGFVVLDIGIGIEFDRIPIQKKKRETFGYLIPDLEAFVQYLYVSVNTGMGKTRSTYEYTCFMSKPSTRYPTLQLLIATAHSRLSLIAVNTAVLGYQVLSTVLGYQVLSTACSLERYTHRRFSQRASSAGWLRTMYQVCTR